MLNPLEDTKEWAREQLLSADFGNSLRVQRCTIMLRRMAERAAGRVTEVFEDPAELQGAYKFLEGATPSAQIVDALAMATLRGAAHCPFVYAVIDGTSLSLTDVGGKKDFGSVGARRFPTRGLKVIDAIGVDPDGVPCGLLDLDVWSRGPKAARSKRARRRTGDTETTHWTTVIGRVAERAERADVVPWFVIDREGDAAAILRALDATAALFTVRVSQRERRCVDGATRGSIQQAMARRPVVGHHYVDVPQGRLRSARTAVLEVRFARVRLDVHDGAHADTYVVWASEKRGPRGEEALDWMLYTNQPVASYGDAIAIIESYCHRWRVEDFHRTWKNGHCRVEDTQLRQREHVVRWAAMLAAVALRVERLKHLARTSPDEPATIGLTPMEIEALKAAKRDRFMKRTETVGDEMPTIATAVRWIGQFGGFQGRGTAMPGAATLGRGLERLLVFAAGFERGAKMAAKGD